MYNSILFKYLLSIFANEALFGLANILRLPYLCWGMRIVFINLDFEFLPELNDRISLNG